MRRHRVIFDLSPCRTTSSGSHARLDDLTLRGSLVILSAEHCCKPAFLLRRQVFITLYFAFFRKRTDNPRTPWPSFHFPRLTRSSLIGGYLDRSWTVSQAEGEDFVAANKAISAQPPPFTPAFIRPSLCFNFIEQRAVKHLPEVFLINAPVLLQK